MLIALSCIKVLQRHLRDLTFCCFFSKLKYKTIPALTVVKNIRTFYLRTRLAVCVNMQYENSTVGCTKLDGGPLHLKPRTDIYMPGIEREPTSHIQTLSVHNHFLPGYHSDWKILWDLWDIVWELGLLKHISTNCFLMIRQVWNMT